jgi:hypothetical protein
MLVWWLELRDLELHLRGRVLTFSFLNSALDRLDSQAQFLEPNARHGNGTSSANELVKVSEADVNERGRARRATTTTLNNGRCVIHTRELYHILIHRQAVFEKNLKKNHPKISQGVITGGDF